MENIMTISEAKFEGMVYVAGFINYYLEDENDEKSMVFDSSLNFEIANHLGFDYGMDLETEEYWFKGDLEKLKHKKSHKTVEWCSHCESEVELQNIFKRQTCPECGVEIKPCNLCIECKTDCPLDLKSM